MRTLLAAPKALLLDEPFSKLDSELRRDFRRFVFDRATAGRLPVLLVTHDPGDAAEATGEILVLGRSAKGARSHANLTAGAVKRSSSAGP